MKVFFFCSFYINTILFLAITPIAMNHLEKRKVFLCRPWLEPLLVVGLCGIILTFATPLACALFVQRVPIKVHRLEAEIQVFINYLLIY